MKYLHYERREQIGILRIDRPQALNALNSAVIAELSELLDSIASSDLRCLIITGAGDKAFVAGADIAEMKDLQPDQARTFSEAGNVVMEKLENLPMPSIAAINGYALGGGCELALACDIRIASERASFAFPEVSLGIIPGYGGIQRLVRLIGPARAKAMIFTAERIKAEAALSIGLVNSLAAPDELMGKAIALAEKIAAAAPLAVRAAKQVASASLGLNPVEANRLEVDPFAACFASSDQKEAMSAFLEKRQPRPFSGE